MSSLDIELSEEERVELSRRTRSATISQRDGRRARVILLAAQGHSRKAIAQLTGLSLVSVTRWCQRFQAADWASSLELSEHGAGRRHLPRQCAADLGGQRHQAAPDPHLQAVH